MNYYGLTPSQDSNENHLGGNMVQGDPFTFSPSVWNYVIDRFSIRSVLDLGSGYGYSAQFMSKKGMQVVAVDGLKTNCLNSIFPTLYCDLTKDSVFCKVDLVHCQEVVEHIEEKYITNLLDSLTQGKFLIMTNALPGQGGHHHVNEQPTEYWINHLNSRGYNLLVEDSNRIRKLAAQDGAIYLAQTGIVMAKL